MAWLVLILSGVLEAVWASALGATQGFRKWKPTLLFAGALVVSMAGLAYAMAELPTGTSYAVWTGTGAGLTVLWAMASGRERATLVRSLLLIGLIGCVVGLKAVA